MSRFAYERLIQLRMLEEAQDLELRHMIYHTVQELTGLPCDMGTQKLTDEQFKELVKKAKHRRKQQQEQSAYSDTSRSAAVIYGGAQYCG